MTGILLSIISGVTFGVFQTVNRRATQQTNAYQATLVLLLVSSSVLILISAVFEDLTVLRSVPPLAIVYFTLAAVVHFVIGWTLFSISQKKVGAARTGVLLGTVPLWGTLIGVVLFAEFLSGRILFGILLMLLGTYFVTSDKAKLVNVEIEMGIQASLYGMGTAVCFAGSSIFIRYGLELLSSPLLGVMIGMVLATVLYGLFLWAQMVQRGERFEWGGSRLRLQIFAGILVAVATWWRWVALDLTPIAVVISLSRLSIPTVLILSPLIIGQKFEHVNQRVWLGAAVILAGAIILTFS